jgi:hypothetical protein
MKKIWMLTVGAALACATFAAAVDYSPSLLAEINRLPENGWVPISIAMGGGVDPAALEDMTAGLSKSSARRLVIDVASSRSESAQAEVLAFLKEAEARGEARKITPVWAANAIGAEVSVSLVGKIAALRNVERIGLDKAYPVTCALAWGVDKIEADHVWNQLNIHGEGIVVAVCDTGCDYLHNDLANRHWDNTDEIPNNGIDDDSNGFIDDDHGWNFSSNNNSVRGGSGGHGSHCAGTVCGDGTSGTETGVANGAKVMAVQVLTNSGSGNETSCWNGLQYSFTNGADVTSMSLGWTQNLNPARATWRSTMETLIAGGMIYCIAAGNERTYSSLPVPNNIRTPGDVPAVITVGSTDSSDVYSYFSSYGPVGWGSVSPYNDYAYPPGLTKPDVCGPGSSITSVRGLSTNAYSVMSGTSMATPHTAGLAALMLSVQPTLTNAQVRTYMETYALDLGTAGKDNDYGSGRIRAFETVSALIPNGITLKSFTAAAAGNGVKVSWETSSEKMLAGFNLYRVRLVEKVAAAAVSRKQYEKVNGDLITGKSPYVYADRKLERGARYAYLLENVDVTGRTQTYGPVVARVGEAKPASYWLAACAPNPVRERTSIAYAVPEGAAGAVTLAVYDAAGRKVATMAGDGTAGEHEVVLDATSLAPGVYVYRLTAGDFTAAKRMVVAH